MGALGCFPPTELDFSLFYYSELAKLTQRLLARIYIGSEAKYAKTLKFGRITLKFGQSG